MQEGGIRMRITTRMMTNKYNRSLNTLSSSVNKLNDQISSGRSFSKASENPAAAISAFQIRRDLSKLESYQSNISFSSDVLKNAESSLMDIHELTQTANDRILEGINGSMSTSERTIVAKEIRSIQEQLLQSLNANSSSGSYYFGGTQTDTSPFSAVNGKLQYKGVDLDSIPQGSAQETQFKNDALYIDIGLNIQFDAIQTQKLDGRTAFNMAVPGISFVGNGTTTINSDTYSNNIYNLLGSLADGLEAANYSSDTMNGLLGQFQKQSENVLMSVTEIGSKNSYLEFMNNRLDSESSNLLERQSEIEYADPAETVIEYKSQEMAYNAALQMGSKIIQNSIFDFIN
jgi:flagellar hook-associated protein 3 FlgL